MSPGESPAERTVKSAVTHPDRQVSMVLATDIGGDADDVWALAQCLRTPALSLDYVLTERGNPRYRARVAAKLLQRGGHADVPIGLGRDDAAVDTGFRLAEPWVEEYDLSQYPGSVHEDGVENLLAHLRSRTDPITVLGIGPIPTLAGAVDRDPSVVENCRFVGMYGSFDVGYDRGEPSAESNVRCAPAELRRVLDAPWDDVLLTPLDTCGRVTLTGDRFARIWRATDDPLIRGVVECNCLFAAAVPWMAYDDFTRRSSTLYDTVAVQLAHDESLVEIERLRFDVTDDGYTVPNPSGQFEARVALDWVDLDTFEDQLTGTLLGTS